MLSNFRRIRCRNGSFLASDILLDRFKTIRAASEKGGVVNGLEFIVLNSEARITDHWRGGGVSDRSLSCDILAKWVEVFFFRVCVRTAV